MMKYYKLGSTKLPDKLYGEDIPLRGGEVSSILTSDTGSCNQYK